MDITQNPILMITILHTRDPKMNIQYHTTTYHDDILSQTRFRGKISAAYHNIYILGRKDLPPQVGS